MFALLIEGGTVKPGKAAELTSIWTSQIMPNLKKQDGFLDAVLLLGTAPATDGISLSFWEAQENAEQYKARMFQENYNKLRHLIDGTPKLRVFEVKTAGAFRTPIREVA